MAALPDAQKPEIYRWFYLPVDTHYRDYGNEIYGGLVANLLIEKYTHSRTQDADPAGATERTHSER